MTDFIKFRDAVNKQIQRITKNHQRVFKVSIDKDLLWQTYLSAFPEGTNPIFRERTEHDCNCCKNFIRDVGTMVAVDSNGNLQTIWDVNDVPETYHLVATALAETVREGKIEAPFRHRQAKVGHKQNYDTSSSSSPITWDHFYADLPRTLVMSDSGTFIGNCKSNYSVLKRSLEEITNEAVDIVNDLIAQDAIYRGAEHKSTVQILQKMKLEYATLSDNEKELYLWIKSVEMGGAARIRNTVIGTLLIDISEGVDLERAVKSFEDKVAPHNYKRTTALITKGMIDKAEKKINELGLNDALYRRHAVPEDVSVANVLFADKSTREKMRGAFEGLTPTAADKVPSKSGIQEVSIDKFVNDILPNITSIEAYVGNRLCSNLVSLIAPLHSEAGNIFKWNNNFSWSYNGEVTDSIKERVKKAGGDVTGELRISLSWFNYDDLDIHVHTPSGKIYYGNRREDGGVLDVDMNVHPKGSREAVENVTWKRISNMSPGNYRVCVRNFAPRETCDVGFQVEVEYKGEIQTFAYNKRVSEDVDVLEFRYDPKEGISFKPVLPSSTASREVWGIDTEKFHKVNMAMLSPNFWDGQEIGNKHWFFILDKCVNPDPARGFYNEFLRGDLVEHRKVFETLSSKLKAEYSDRQLSGLGFSSTQRNELIVRVKGAYSRTLKIKF